MAPFIGLLATAFTINGTSRSYSSAMNLTPSQEIEQTGDLSNLCTLFRASPVDLLSLQTNQEGIRGVYLKKAVSKNDVILKIPLNSCLRDDLPPQWLQETPPNEEEDAYAVSVEGWVTRLTACLIDTQLMKDEKSEAMQIWLDLLPKNLRQLLPIHFDTALLGSAKCRSLEVAVDSAYFARAGPIEDLMASIRDSNLGLTQNQVEDALDLVQTRSCRAEASDGTPYMRVLVPIFDLINHDRNHNAEFYREGNCMVVRAIRDIDADRQVFINYGGSTQPAWKCLFSYGFVPLSEDVYEDDSAELIVDGMRFELGPTELPFELVQFEAERSGQYTPGEELEFTAEIGQSIVDRLMDAAKDLKGPPNEEENNRVDISSVRDLREANRRTLLACAGGLREYLEEL
mmetsp:Transcript_39009/g.57396  ORF Transcript_39009/g.57396 Transcript_39009/m.57396 type:complete len:401 (-) Transcript_39009:486-1688(-)|eukprot:CAMPEP_0195541630 /NCGR_PEP_ID=MMETSP0794_2-20130614/51188_1 /TAXON_ID=515487 /ORGANISM="Stephanopyxis turris, Strain CCMP 815" /LENGTH=400 /DNA_ID=CAMNT_0040675733 /DNA_START=22 /DNA_END=1224 /DNA_ORIENTATION=-